MANFSSLKAKIVTKLQSITDLGSNGVFNYEPSQDNIDQDPFAIVVSSDNEAEFASTQDNRRIYGFVIRLFVERNNRGESDAESTMVSLVDSVIDAFDQDVTLGGEALMVEAAPSAWEYVLSTKEYRVAEVRIRCLVWFDTT